jgi:hypothetical protein
MTTKSAFIVILTLHAFVVAVGAPPASPVPGPQAQAAPAQNAVARRIGVIKAINGSAITLAPDSGSEITVNVQPAARLLRIAPGEKDLKNATPVQLQELQVGDTIRVRGMASGDAKSLAALEILVITRSTLDAVRDQVRQDWQKRGLGGVVTAVDAAAHTITISVTGFGGTKNIAVHASNDTVFRRYAPESIKFEDAKSGTLQEIQPGDQLRTRGNRSADGAEFTAEEIVTGSFRNIAGTVNSVDANAGTISVQDLLSKKTVQVKITADSQLRKLPPEMAQRIAMRLRGAMAGAVTGGGTAGAGANTSAAQPANSGQAASGSPPSGTGYGAGMGGGMRPGGAPDFQQMLGRMPAVTLADLHKGDAVMLVATQGTPTGASTAITMLSGVEPILQAAPTASQAMMLAPWSLGGAPGGDAASQ